MRDVYEVDELIDDLSSGRTLHLTLVERKLIIEGLRLVRIVREKNYWERVRNNSGSDS